MPALFAARTFSLIPPTGRTFPLRVISPVMAILGLMGLSEKSETRAVVMAVPADGPSLGIEPSGT